ncbi:MAG TPA: ATP-binding protein [Alphaproteobacteria bacterium]
MRYQRPLVLLVIAALLPLVILSAALGTAWLRQQHAAMQEDALDRVDRISALLDRELTAQITLLKLMAASPLFDGPPNEVLFFRVAESIRSELPLWNVVVLSDVQGNRLIDVPELVSGTRGRVVDLTSHEEVVRTLKPVVGRILKGPRNRPAFAIRVPVVRNDELLFVLSAVIQPDRIIALLRAGGIPEGWTGAVLDTEGQIVARTSGPAELIGSPASAGAREAVQSATSGLYQGPNAEGKPMITAFRVLPASGWSVHIGIPRELFLTPLHRSAWLLAAGVAMTLALVSAFLWLLWRELRVRRRTEAALEETRRLEALGRITGGVAHDFNNLLMIVQGSAEAILRRHRDPQSIARYADAILAAAGRGERLTRQLLAFAGRSSTEPVAFRLQDRESDLLSLLTQSTRGDIRVALSIPSDTWPIHADPHALELALINLAVNARDAMREGGNLSVSAANVTLAPDAGHGTGLKGDFVALRVEDTGSGIPEQDLGRIFEPFYTTKATGTGLGLSQVYGFAKQSGGTITVSSTPAGTIFTLYLPRAATEPASRPARVAAGAPSAPERGRALLVEDNAEVAAVVEGMLAAAGFAVTAASSGAVALAKLQDGEAFDLVLSDIVMEGMSGLDLAARIRERDPGLPVILMTGYSDALLMGSSDGLPVLSKPFRHEELEAVLAETRAVTGEAAFGVCRSGILSPRHSLGADGEPG